jgi:hypothetical protein
MILYGTNLINKIRSDFDNATDRIWIVVPFIGDWASVKKIMGTKWIGTNNLNMKIITDIRNEDFINAETIKQFLLKGDVKTLLGVHAKIYIIDNSVFITSANLTGTAFSKRYEICEHYNITDEHDIIKVFNDWWLKSKKVNIDWKPSTKSKIQADYDTGNISGLKKLWNLPEGSIKVRNFKDYQDNLISYNHILKIYDSDEERLLPSLTNYHELDAFLNYLFHEDEHTPSFIYINEKYRKLSSTRQFSEIRKYKTKFKRWLNSNPNHEDYRKRRIYIVQKNLNLKTIEKLDRKTLEKVVEVLHTMNSYALNKYKFLNPQNNELKTIKDSFKILLHDDRAIEERMEICNENLNSFGKSSICELVSWFYPDQYPIMNRNTNSGLKFLGYDIKTY